MPSNERKKELTAAYRARTEVGGVCAIRCIPTQRILLYAAPDAQGQRNRFRFSQSTDTCVHAALAADWRAHGSAAFEFQVLEALERSPDQSPQSFRADLDALAELWRDKLTRSGALLYG